VRDFDIVELYLKKDEKAISESALSYGGRLRKLAFEITASEEDAAECENDTYLAAWEAIPPASPHDYLYAFLARITRCKAINRLKEQKALKRSAEYVEFTEELAECIPALGATEDAINEKLLSEAISRFLFVQKPEKRQIFMRRYWYFDSEATIAKEFGFSKEKVKVTLFRLRNELKKHLEREGYEVGR